MTTHGTSEAPVSGADDPTQTTTSGAPVMVKVWQLPIRVAHWTVVLSVTVLSFTGFYIGTPFFSPRGDTGFLMGWMRSIHSLAAWLLIAAILARVVFAFTGNRWARWDQFVPTTRERRANVRQTFLYYTFLRRDPPTYAGHNAMAGVAYLAVFGLFVAQAFTGLALYSLDYPSSLAASLSGWVFSVAEIPTVRMIHHLTMWAMWAFVIQHVYSATLMNVEEKSGLFGSMWSGWKRVPSDRL